MEKACLVFITTGGIEEAERIAEELIKDRLAACVNIIPGLTSIYRWKGEICKEKEILLILKTVESLLPRLKELVLKLHSYELPEIISLPICGGFEKYLQWIEEECQQKPQK